MDWDNVSKVVIASAGAVAAAAKVIGDMRATSSRREQIRKDIELLNLLDVSSTARVALAAHVDGAILQLIEDEAEKRRDPTGVALAFFFLLLALWSGISAFAADGSKWWLLLAVPSLLLGLVGLSQDGVRRKRDERNRAIRQPKRNPRVE
jgi:hypothetical protein